MRVARDERVLIGGSFLCRDFDGEVRNAFLLAGSDGLLGRHDKDLPTMWENALYVGGNDDGVIEAPDLTVGAAVCWEFMRSGTASRLRGRVDLVLGGSNWWSIPRWPPTAYTRRAEAANAATAARAPSVFGRYVGAPVAHAAITGAFSCPMPELPGVTYHGRFEGGAQIADAHGRVLARRDGSEGSGYVIADVDAQRTEPREQVPDRFWLHRSAPDAATTHSPASVVREVCEELVQSLCDASGRPRQRPRWGLRVSARPRARRRVGCRGCARRSGRRRAPRRRGGDRFGRRWP
jgi:predicted amidohydrolase